MLDGRALFIVLLSTTVLFFISFIIVLFVYVTQTANFIDPSECLNNVIVVHPATSGVIRQCGSGNCTFPATSLQAAVNECSARADICQNFLWDGANVTFVNRPFNESSVDNNVYSLV